MIKYLNENARNIQPGLWVRQLNYPISSDDDMNPPIYLKYEPASLNRSGTGSGYNAPNMYWNEAGYIAHAFGPAYTQLAVLVNYSVSREIAPPFEFFVRDFDQSSGLNVGTAVQSPIPGSQTPIDQPYPANDGRQFLWIGPFDIVPGRAFNLGLKRLATGPTTSVRLYAATYKFIAP